MNYFSVKIISIKSWLINFKVLHAVGNASDYWSRCELAWMIVPLSVWGLSSLHSPPHLSNLSSKISRTHSWWSQNAQLCHCSKKQRQPRSDVSSWGSRNLQQRYNLWRGHGVGSGFETTQRLRNHSKYSKYSAHCGLVMLGWGLRTDPSKILHMNLLYKVSWHPVGSLV